MTAPAGGLAPDAIHVWRIQTDQSRIVARRLEGYLGVKEARKADAYRREADWRRFVVAHGALREILAWYTSRAPQDVTFRFTTAGKPFLTDRQGGQPLRFSLSHSGEWALVGVSLSVDVGVDIEEIDSAVSAEAVVERFFSRRESEAFQAVPPEHRTAAFFAAWTRKEAYVKARGDGVVNRLHRFSVSVDPRRLPILLDDSLDAHAPLHWSIYDLNVASGYAAAVAAERTQQRLQLIAWGHSPQ